MAVVSIAGAAFTVTVDATQYTDQITQGTITTTPTVTRTVTLGGVSFVQTDLNSTVSLSFLYDEASGLYDALQSAIAGATDVALSIVGGAGTWTGAAVWCDSAEVTFDATGIASCTASFTGPISFA